jgi:hypothetical protein
MANISNNYDDHENFLAALPFCCLDDSSFNTAMYELAHISMHYDSDRLDTLLFNPITDQFYFDDLLDNLDTDKHFPVHCSNSYMAHYDINATFKSKQDVVPSFSVLHINACSLLNKFDDIKSLLENMPHLFSDIGISETWLTDTMHDLVNCDCKHRLLTNCIFSDPNLIESLFVDIHSSQWEKYHNRNSISTAKTITWCNL